MKPTTAVSTRRAPPVLKSGEAERLSTQFKALANPVRLRMLDLIARRGGQICVCEFEGHFDLTQPTLSHHLKTLREAGLIESRQEGQWVFHDIESEAVSALASRLAAWVFEETEV